ncbi:MAG: methyltransferase domain-containing protein [Actinomycetota bacterium]
MTPPVDATVSLHGRDGAVHYAPEWSADADAVDARVLTRAVAPVIDIGCGPGRHVAALARLGCVVLGIDIAAPALEIARGRGVVALERSVFRRVPGAGRWRTALLLDGNLGIGGDPERLLVRVRELLVPGGCALVEAAPPGQCGDPVTVRLDVGARSGPWFMLAPVAIDDVEGIARDAQFSVVARWLDEGRWFAALESR